MEKELIINSSPTEVEIALLEKKKLAEIHYQKTNSNFTVGDIFLGKVKKLMPGLNAAFVDIGYKKDAFLHYTDLGPNLNSLMKFTDTSITKSHPTHLLDNFTFENEIVKTGKISQVLNRKNPILIQILKEPISTKGPRLSCEVTIPGRYLVLTPFSNVVSVSKKIGDAEERKRLKRLVESIRPKNFGLIVRTAAGGKRVADLHEELLILTEKWQQMYEQLHNAKAPKKILSELDKTSSILRDILTDSFNRIIVNDKELYNNIRSYLMQIAPDQVKIVELYNGSKSIFDQYGVTRQIKASFGKTATMSSGAYLVIEHTEAMHVIDVNSGHKIHNNDQESNTLAVNLEAAEEIARQLRLRDIGGIIIVDFIDMRNTENRRQLYAAMKDFMKKDRAQHTILPLSKFGLLQITRQRVRPEVNITTAEKCPTCNGSGKVNATILLTDELERDLDFIIKSQPKANLHIQMHPYLYAYCRQNFYKKQIGWFKKYKKWIKLSVDNDFQLTEYRFYDEHHDEIRLNS